MNKILVAIFNTEEEAYKGLAALKDLNQKGDISLYATAVLVSDASGKVTVKQQADPGPLGTALGALTGAVVGLLGGPIGMVVGTGVGGGTGFLFDIAQLGISSDVVDEVSKQLGPGKAAVLAEVDETWMAPVDTTLGQLGAVVSRQYRSQFVAEQMERDSEAFDRELNRIAEQINQLNADDRAEAQKEIEAMRKQRDAKLAQAKANLEQAKRESDAKIQILQNQLKDADAKHKASIEKRIADAKVAQQALGEKLKQAEKRAKEGTQS